MEPKIARPHLGGKADERLDGDSLVEDSSGVATELTLPEHAPGEGRDRPSLLTFARVLHATIQR